MNTPAADFSLNQDNWQAFSQSLVEALETQLSPTPDKTGRMLLITAPHPVVPPTTPSPSGLLPALRRRFTAALASPSPEEPGIVVVGQSQGAQLNVPFLDECSRLLLDPPRVTKLTSAGWSKQVDVLQRTVTAAQLGTVVTDVLIEVLEVAHPADLNYLFHTID